MSNDSAATTRTANERCMEICHSCISYLNDRFVFEKGLFRSPASLTDVRLLQTQMMYQGSVINHEMYFQECLRDKSCSPFIIRILLTENIITYRWRQQSPERIRPAYSNRCSSKNLERTFSFSTI